MRVRELTPQVSEDFRTVRRQLEAQGIHQLYPDELTSHQRDQLNQYLKSNVLPLISPQIVNATHPFILKTARSTSRCVLTIFPSRRRRRRSVARPFCAKAAEDVLMGIIPMPRNCPRTIKLDSEGEGYSFHTARTCARDGGR